MIYFFATLVNLVGVVAIIAMWPSLAPTAPLAALLLCAAGAGWCAALGFSVWHAERSGRWSIL